MREPAALIIEFLACVVGFAWLALAMDVHWQQVRGDGVLGVNTKRLLRILAATAIVASLALCLVVDHASMATLVWVMSLAGSALIVAFALSWRPRWLALLVIWVRPMPRIDGSSAKTSSAG